MLGGGECWFDLWLRQHAEYLPAERSAAGWRGNRSCGCERSLWEQVQQQTAQELIERYGHQFLEQQIVDHLFILQSHGGELRRQSEHDMNVTRGEKFATTCLTSKKTDANLRRRVSLRQPNQQFNQASRRGQQS